MKKTVARIIHSMPQDREKECAAVLFHCKHPGSHYCESGKSGHKWQAPCMRPFGSPTSESIWEKRESPNIRQICRFQGNDGSANRSDQHRVPPSLTFRLLQAHIDCT